MALERMRECVTGTRANSIFSVGRPHAGEEVYVTGTFDNWNKSEKMEKVGDKFEKSVELPDSSEKIYYKVGEELFSRCLQDQWLFLSFLGVSLQVRSCIGSSRSAPWRCSAVWKLSRRSND